MDKEESWYRHNDRKDVQMDLNWDFEKLLKHLSFSNTPQAILDTQVGGKGKNNVINYRGHVIRDGLIIPEDTIICTTQLEGTVLSRGECDILIPKRLIVGGTPGGKIRVPGIIINGGPFTIFNVSSRTLAFYDGK